MDVITLTKSLIGLENEKWAELLQNKKQILMTRFLFFYKSYQLAELII
jgi:hypothetical protein